MVDACVSGGAGVGRLARMGLRSALVVALVAGMSAGTAPPARSAPPAAEASGTLRVTTSPALPATIFVDGIARDTWGLNWVPFPVGAHQVCFGTVPGFTAPGCQTVTVSPGAVTAVVGSFSAMGYLHVVTSPAVDSTISVDGVARNDWSVWTPVAPGTHQVCFSEVPGLDPPPCRDVTVTARATATTTGTFTSRPGAPGPAGTFGFLRATTSPPVAAMISVDGLPRDAWALTWLRLPVGSHQVCFGPAPNATAPTACQSAVVAAGATTAVIGSYTLHGFLRVLTNPAVPGPITVDGEVANAWGVWADKAPGRYDVCFGDIDPRYVPPPCLDDVSVSAGGTTTVTGTYTPRPGGDVTFARTLIDASDTGADVKGVADIDGDGDNDVVAGDDSGLPLVWYENPSWTRRVIDSRSVFTTDLELGDVDRDGDVDVIVPDAAAGTMLWYANPRIGGGSWLGRTIGAAFAHDVQVGDQDGDGDLDVAVRGPGGPTVLFVQASTTSWGRRVLPAPDGEGLGYGDLDGDGDLDIAQNGWWLEAPANPLTGAWVDHTLTGTWPALVAAEVADVDRDGRNDIVLAASEGGGRLSWYRAPADPRTGTWTEHVVDDSVGYVHQFVVADIDRDGRSDIAFAEMAASPTKRIGWFENDGGGTSWTLRVFAATGSHNIRVADMDRDLDLDVVGANHDGTSPLELWRNLSTP